MIAGDRFLRRLHWRARSLLDRAFLPPVPSGTLDPAALWLRKRGRHSP